MRRSAWLLVLVSALLGSPAPAANGPPARVFVGYLYGAPKDLDYKLYTHLCHAFLTADADGTIHRPRGMKGRDLAAEAHARGVSVLISLGGWGWDDQFRRIAANPEVEARYVADVLKEVDESDYDGVDFDWEYPDTPDEVAGFEAMSAHLRAGLDALAAKKGRPMRLTMAVSSNPGTLRHLHPEFMVKTYDWLNVMTYDMAGDWTAYAGHNAPLFPSSKVPGGKGPSAAGVIDFLIDDQKYPPEKLALGLPLYGRGFPVARPYDPSPKRKEGEPRPRLPQGDYRNLNKLMAGGGWKRTWEEETKVPWLVKDDGTAVFGFDDPESIRLKVDWANRRGLRGVFFWQVDGDRLPDGSNPLQRAARERWDAAGKP